MELQVHFQYFYLIILGPRCRHTSIVIDDKMYIYGGETVSTKNCNRMNVYNFTNNSWEELLLKEDGTNKSSPYLDSHTMS